MNLESGGLIPGNDGVTSMGEKAALKVREIQSLTALSKRPLLLDQIHYKSRSL